MVAPAASIGDVEILDVASTDPESVFNTTETERDSFIAEKLNRKGPASKPKSSAPTAEEWQNFLARIVFRGITSGYVALVIGDLESELSEWEKEKIKLSVEQLKELARPSAEYMSKTSFNRRKGRAVVSSTEALESFLILFFWMRRVNKIAKAHKPRTVRGKAERSGPVRPDSRQQPPTEESSGPYIFNPGTG